MKRWMIGLAGLVVVSLATTNAFSAIDVVIDSGILGVYANDNDGDGASQQIAATMSLSATSTATDGTATSSATYDFSNSGGTAAFNINSMTQSFGVGDYYASAYGEFDFTLSETATYSIAGAFSGSGTDSGDGYYEYVYLYDHSASADVFYEYDYVFGTDASLAFDGVVQGSGYSNGTLTGTLTPGQYTFAYETLIHDYDYDQVGSADASGYVNLTLKVTPEPSTFVVWSLLGALGITVGWWRRKRYLA